MLRYRSPLVKLARLAAMAIPLVFNFVEVSFWRFKPSYPYLFFLLASYT